MRALRDDVVSRHLAVSIELGIAERAPQVTAGKADKHSRPARMPSFTLQRVKNVINSHEQNGLFLVGGDISLALLHGCLVAVGHTLHHPMSQVLGCGVEGQHVIQHTMVDRFLY